MGQENDLQEEESVFQKRDENENVEALSGALNIQARVVLDLLKGQIIPESGMSFPDFQDVLEASKIFSYFLLKNRI